MSKQMAAFAPFAAIPAADWHYPEIRQTHRPTSDFMEDTLAFGPIKVLDHGFLRVVDYMGTERSIIDRARVSYQAGTTWTSGERELLRYLMRNHHTTPFEAGEIELHVKLPIFVARQWVRHRMASINEVSARYSVLDNEFYIPEPAQIAPQAKDNKQGRSGELTQEQTHMVRRLLKEDALCAYEGYNILLGGDVPENAHFRGGDDAEALATDKTFPGIARELARMGLSLNFYTQWYWKTDTKNLLDFLRLRADAHAQYEIRVYAEIMEQIVAGWMPDVFGAYLDYRKNAFTLSGPMVEILRQFVRDCTDGEPEQIERVPDFGARLSKREQGDMLKMLGYVSR